MVYCSWFSVRVCIQYVAVVVTFQLFRTSVTVREQLDVPELLRVQMIDLSTRICQRPGAQAFRWDGERRSLRTINTHLLVNQSLGSPCRVEAALQHWYVTGLQQQGVVPSLVASVGDSSSSLLNVVFEVNPEESSADQLLRVRSQPVEITYDAVTASPQMA